MKLRALASLGLLSLTALSACGDKKATAIVVAFSSEARPTGEIDALQIIVRRGGAVPFDTPYELPRGAPLPGTLTVSNVEGEASDPVTVEVVATKEGKARVLRRARLAFTEGKQKLLRMPLRYSCVDFPDTCGPDETCAGYQCVPIDGEVARVRDAADSPLPPGVGVQGAQATDAGCFDAAACLRDAKPVPVAPDCTLAVPFEEGKYNLFMRWKVAPDNPVAVDLDDPLEGFVVGADGKPRLAPGLCKAITAPRSPGGGALDLSASDACPQKPAGVDPCTYLTEGAAGGGGAGGKAGSGGAGQGGAGKSGQGGAGAGGAGQAGQGGGAGKSGQGGAGAGGAGQGGAGQGGAGQGGAGQGGAGQGGAGQGGAGQAGAGQGGAGQAGAGGATPCVEGTYQCTMAGASLCMGGAWMPEVPCDFGCDAAGCQQCAIASDCVVDPCMTAACVQGKCQSTPMSDGTTCGPGQGNPQVCFGGACIDKCSGTGPLCVGRQPATCNLVTGLPLPQGAPCDIACSSGQCAAVAGLALGGDHSCLVTDQLSVWCWGENDLGQLGIGVTDGDAHHQPELSLAMGEKLAAGANHACVKDFDGVACWGDNGKGQLGAGITASPQTSPTPAVWAGSPPSPVQWIAAGQGFTIVQSSTDTWSAGDNSSQQFGVSTPPSSVSFEQLPLVSLSLQLVQAGRAHACALDSNSGLICWGDNSRGQLLLPASVSEGILQMPVAGPVTDLAVGGDNSCYLENGKLACAGDNSFGQLGVSPDSSPHEVAQTILAPGTQQWTRAVVGEGFVCATSSLGDVYCWGKNDVGQLGSDTGGTPSPMKQKVSLPFKPTLLAAGRDHVCAATTTAVSCWGGVTAGKLGRFGFSHDPGPVDFKP